MNTSRATFLITYKMDFHLKIAAQHLYIIKHGNGAVVTIVTRKAQECHGRLPCSNKCHGRLPCRKDIDPYRDTLAEIANIHWKMLKPEVRRILK